MDFKIQYRILLASYKTPVFHCNTLKLQTLKFCFCAFCAFCGHINFVGFVRISGFPYQDSIMKKEVNFNIGRKVNVVPNGKIIYLDSKNYEDLQFIRETYGYETEEKGWFREKDRLFRFFRRPHWQDSSIQTKRCTPARYSGGSHAAITGRAGFTAIYDNGRRDGYPLDSTPICSTQIQPTTLAQSYRPL